ncbi:MAG TPA: DHA2 family efflux MFS transporter permease subunit [Candidatus Paceibacterota bacterium]|nr:DHA2 family efflux MFS transporter permease subunit [Candidatus Paceibacterota bacterium]
MIDKRWLAFAVLCLGDLMIVLDMTVVNVALPSIKEALGFSDAALVWVVNAYLLTFGGFLLLGGRLGDLYGQRRLFLAGLGIFTAASLLCGIADSQTTLIVARAIQGVGGAIASAIALALVINMFPDHAERAKAMGIFGFIMAGGGSVGVLLGGFLTAIDWHWNFLINLPIGAAVYVASLYLLPALPGAAKGERLDYWGAIAVTLSLLLANYAIIGGNAAGWTSLQTLLLFAGAAALFTLFVFIETRAKHPLMPLSLFRLRNLSVASIAGVLWAAAMFAWFFFSALYMQSVLGYSPREVGLAFLPANIIMAIFSVWLSAKVVMRFGVRIPIALGLGLASLGLLLLVRAPLDASFWIDIFPSMVLLGLGAGMAFNPVLLAAMGGVPEHESGLASGVVNTAFMMGGSVGLAVLASTASFSTSKALASGASALEALNSGYHIAFLIGAIFAGIAAGLGFLLKESSGESSPHPAH